MAIQHVRELQKRRAEYSPVDYAIMEVICTDIGNNDQPCHTSLRTIAARADCHYNTVGQGIKRLAESGRLIIGKRGKYSLYSLPAAEDCHNEYVTKEELSQKLSHLEAKLSQRIDEVAEKLSRQIEGLSQQLSHIVTTLSAGNVTEGKKDKESPLPPKGEERGVSDYADNVWNHVLGCFGGNQDKAKAVIVAQVAYAGISGNKQPYVNGRRETIDNAARDWWLPLYDMISEVNHDQAAFSETVKGVFSIADEKKLTISTPKTAVATFKNLAGRQRRGVGTAQQNQDGSYNI